MNKIKLLFVATGDYGVPILEKLSEDTNFEIIGVITATDKPQGRKLVLTPTQVKVTALRFGLKVLSPKDKNELFEVFDELKPDIALVVAYGMIFPEKILNIPKYRCVNIHGSILPKYRGASPIHQAILNGDTETGNTWTLMDRKMDAGPIISTSHVAIEPDDRFQELYTKLAQNAADLTPSVILNYIKTGQSSPQNDKEATKCSTIDKTDGLVDFKKQTARDIYNKFRAYSMWPNVYFKTKNMNIKITQLSIVDQLSYSNVASGNFINLNNKKLIITTLDGALELIEVQPPSKKPMSGISFLNGYKDELENWNNFTDHTIMAS